MGRRPTVNLNLPKGMRARKRTRKNGTVVTYYFYDGRDENGRRKEYPLGTDYVLAVQEWGRLEQESSQATAAATFTAAAARYTADVLVHRAENTQRNSRLLLKNLICFFGNPDAPLDQIQPQHIRQYLDWRKDSPAAANIEIGLFVTIFNHARNIGYTSAANPASGVKRFPKSRRDHYVEDRIFRMVYQHADRQMRDLMDIAYLTGQRPVDIVGINSSQIVDGILHITQQKTGKKLRFEISGSLKTIFDRICPPETQGNLFRNARGGALTRSLLAKNFLALRRKLIAQYPQMSEELEAFQFRDLRAKSGTDLYLAADRNAAKEQLGHSSEQMTNTYIRKGKIIKPIIQPVG